MESNALWLIDKITFESLVISIISFLLTLLFKIPIKKITNNYDEGKRQTINGIIVLIPALLSLLLSLTYVLIAKVAIYNLFQISINAWLVSLSIYAIYEKIKIIIIGLFNKKNSIQLINSVNFEINGLISKLDVNNKNLLEIKEKLSKLMELKNKIKSTDLSNLFEINVQMKKLHEEKKLLEKQNNEFIKNISLLKGE